MQPVNPNKPSSDRLHPILKPSSDLTSKIFWPLFTSAVLGSAFFLGRKKFSFNQISYLNTLYKKINFSKFQNPLTNSNLKIYKTPMIAFGLSAFTFCPAFMIKNKDALIVKRSVCSILTPKDLQKKSEISSTLEIAKASINYEINPPPIVKKEIIIRSSYPTNPSIEPDFLDSFFPPVSINLSHCDLASMNISDNKAKKLLIHFSSLVSQPKKFLGLLKGVEDAISIELHKKGIFFTENDNPDFLIEGKGIFIIGPPKEGAKLKSKGRIIDEVLLKEEQKIGLNLKGSPVFVGFVDSEKVDPFIMEGNTFKEDVSVSRMLLHGKNIHRLAILAFMESLKGTEFEGISPKVILNLLVNAKIGNSSAWSFLIDSNSNMPPPSLDSNTFDYNCRSPFVFNSLILCFGDKFGLPNLTHCMRDSFWKSADKMIAKVQENSSATQIPKTSIYLTIMKELVTANDLDVVNQRFSFTNKEIEAALKAKYIPHPDSIEGIKLKTPKGSIADPVTHKKNLSTMMRNPKILSEISGDLKNKELVLEFLEKQTPLEELGSLASYYSMYSYNLKFLLQDYSDNAKIFVAEIIKKRCKTPDQKTTIIPSLLNNQSTESNHIALEFITDNLELLPTLMQKLTTSQKDHLLIAAIKEGSINLIEKMIDSGVVIRDNDHQRNLICRAIIDNDNKEIVHALVTKFPELMDMKDYNGKSVRSQIYE